MGHYTPKTAITGNNPSGPREKVDNERDNKGRLALDTTELRKQHAEVIEQIGVIRALIEMPNSISGCSNIGGRLDVLAATLLLHLSLEDREYYPAFLLSHDETIRSCAERFFVEMGHLRRAFGNFREAWRSDRAMHLNFATFGRDAERVFSVIENRIQRENSILFPLWDASQEGGPFIEEHDLPQVRQHA